MTNVTLEDLDSIFGKYEELRKHIIPPTKDLLNELWEWKRKFSNFVNSSTRIPYNTKCILLGKRNVLEAEK